MISLSLLKSEYDANSSQIQFKTDPLPIVNSLQLKTCSFLARNYMKAQLLSLKKPLPSLRDDNFSFHHLRLESLNHAHT